MFNSLSTFKKTCEVNLIATYYVYRGKYEKALQLYESARKVFEKRGKHTNVAFCDIYIANIYFFALRQENKALQLYKSARKVFEGQGAEIDAARCDRGIARVYEKLGRYNESLKLFEFVRKTISEHKGWRYAIDQTEIAYCDNDIARLNFKLGRYKKALKLFKSVREVFKETWGCKIKVADCEMLIAYVYIEIGYYDKAIELYESARRIFKEQGTQVDVAYCDIDEAGVYSSLGHYNKAIELYESAQRVLEKQGTQVDVAYCDLNRATVLMSLGQNDKALGVLKSAKKVFYERGDRAALSICDFNMASSYAFFGQNNKAFKIYKSFRKECSEKGSQAYVMTCDLNMAIVYMVLGVYEKAFPLFKTVYNDSNRLMDKLKSLYGMGWIYKQKGNFKMARTLYKEAIEEIENTRNSISREELRTSFLATVDDYYYTMVELCIEEKDFEAGLEYVERLKCRNLADLLVNRALTPRNASERDKREYKKLRFKMKDYAYQLSKEQDQARTIVLREEMEQLENKYENMVAVFRKKEPNFDPDQKMTISYFEIRNLVPDNKSAIVEVFPMREKTVFFVLREKKIEKSTIIIPDYNRSDLMNHTIGLLKKYEVYHESKNPQKKEARQLWEDYLDTILKELYKKLFLRIQPYLKGINKIIIIPYSSFHLLPLHAMFTEENGHRRYIIDDYQVSYVPSAKVFKHCMERKRNEKEEVIVALANPEQNLIYAKDEVESVRRLFNSSQLIAKATKNHIINYGRKAHILHFTGHANFKALTLHSDKDNEIKEEYTLEDIFESLDLPRTYLTTLSACETGMTLPGEIDEYIGLNSAFLHAGTATVISSLWQVSDVSTTLLMKKMYELIKAGRGKAEALREAQLWLKNPDNKQEHQDMLSDWSNDKGGKYEKTLSDGNRFDVESNEPEIFLPSDLSRPYYWAGFTCSGAA